MVKSLASVLIVLALQSSGLAQTDSSATTGLEDVKTEVEGMNESLTEVRNFVDALRKIKVSGYLQTQFRYTDLINQPYPLGNFSGGQFPAETKNLFQVRRGRFKLTYDNTLTQCVFEIDIIPTGVTMRDAYLSLTEPWTQSLGLQMGAFYAPFGYEVSFTSSSRESPELSRIVQVLFPGEREVGAKLFFAPQLGSLTFLRADIGVFNGAGTNANEFDNFKNIISRIGIQIPFPEESPLAIDLGVSGHFGHVRSSSKNIFVNGTSATGVKGYVNNTDTANVGKGVSRKYFGADVQLYYDVPSIGGMIIRAELIGGRQPGISSSSISPGAQPASALYHRKFVGWYINLVQNIGNQEQIVLKYDVYDPNTNVMGSDFTPTSGLTATDIKYSTFGIGFIHHWDDNVKFVAYHEFIKNETLDATKIPATSALSPYTNDVRDNVFTFRVQYKL
ncbi:MAG: Porin [Bacteroidetes bacterium]|nr:Porin [Bacteroidota bacterium]